MRLKGKLVQWNEERAFGFIVPNSGGSQIFIHKRAFSNRHRTPQVKDVITFTLSTDKQGRDCAIDAVFAGEKAIPKRPQSWRQYSIVLAALWLVVITAASLLGKLPINLCYAYLALSVITFMAYALDKSKAQRNTWRTPESTLHLLALAGGWPGAAIAQELLPHKSKKQPFRLVYWVTVLGNIAAIIWLHSTHGEHLLLLIG